MANFSPDRFEITAATVANQCVITTDADHGYELDWFVRVEIPRVYGMEVDYVIAQVVGIPADDQLTLDIDTRQQAAFVSPSTVPRQVAQVMPISGQTLNIAS
jgi:hypothetical protein